ESLGEHGEVGAGIEGGHFAEGLFSSIADGPVRRAWRHLDHERLCRTVPDHSPSHRPAVAGAHFSAVHQVDSSFGNLTAIDEDSGRPALMRLHVAVAVKDAVED